MNAYKEAFIKYVTDHPLKYYDAEMDSVLELFYRCYAEGSMKDSTKMVDCFEKMMELLPEGAWDSMFELLCELCTEAQRGAFLEGFRIGGRWGLEIRG